MESPAIMINTQRLKPFCQRTSRTVMSIQENGNVSMEILAKPQSGTQDGTQLVQEMIYISANGVKVQIYQNNLDVVNSDGNGNMSGWSCQEYVFPDLPQKHLKKYMHAYRFIELVKSRTPKIVLMTDRAKCKLMENSPAPDFQVEFHDDNMSILLSKRKVHITDSHGNSMTSGIDNLSESIPENILERFYYLKQCESECLCLEESFNNLNTRGESPEFFPLTIGTSTSLVSIPLPQPTSLTSASSSNLPSHVLTREHVHHHRENSVSPPFHNESISSESVISIPQQYIDQSRNIITLETALTNASEQRSCLSPPDMSHTLSTDQNLSFVPQLEHDFLTYQLSNKGQPILSHLESGANISNTLIAQATQHVYEKQNDNKSPVPSVPSAFEIVPHSCLPQFRTPRKDEEFAQVLKAPSMCESYNKFKYCSQTSPDTTGVDNCSSHAQLKSTTSELFVQQPDISGYCTGENEKLPFQQDCVNPELVCADHIILQQNVHLGLNETENPLLVSKHSISTSSEFSFYSQKTDPFSSTHDKRNSIASSSSSIIGAQSSNYITKEKLDSDEAFCFSPVQSSSIITAYYDSQSPKKMQRKVASPCISSLEKDIEDLDLSAAQLNSPDMVKNSQSLEDEKYDIISRLHDIQRTPKTNTRNLSFITSSSVKTNCSLRSKPEHFNMSLPLYDSKQQGVLSFPLAPQRQFLQPSDNSPDRGNNDFALPPQVRNSLDLSTSSNYSDSPSSSQSSSCEPLYQVFVPYTGWASYYASGAVWVLYNDGTQLGVKASEKTMTFIDQDGSQKKYNNKDIVPEIVKMKLEKFPSVLNAVLNYKR